MNGDSKENGPKSKIDLFESYAERPKSEFVPLPAPTVALRSTLDRPAPAARNTVIGTNSLFGSEE